ncbi:protein HNT2 [Kluyveromyces marxianus]|uniref:Protein HNT2 n=1 Tax=Kluyveromyces marxianus TaxID=4911 RepID=A0ABX6EUZ2_KLUMA|nr:protein HNT2 [Kluyveromyces marxianus]
MTTGTVFFSSFNVTKQVFYST